MKLKNFAIAAVAFALLSSIAYMTPARAQSAKGLNFAVVDVQRILRDSGSTRSIRGEIQDRYKTYLAEIKNEENQLREMGSELARQRTLLSAEAFGQRRQELEQRRIRLQQNVASRKRELDSASNAAMAEVQKTLVTVVSGLAEERRFDLVLARGPAIYVDTKFDITEEVLKRLNAQLPSVKVPTPQR